MAKFTHRISCPCGSTDSRRTEGDRVEEQGSGFSLFPPSPHSLWPYPPSLPPILYVPLSHPPYCPLSSSRIHRKALISMEEEVDRRGATLTQLVRLIKRVCGLWVRAQTHQETGRPKTSLCYRNILGSNKKKKNSDCQNHQ